MTFKIPVDLFPVVDSILQDHQLYHSEFQIDHFVTARGGDHHPWGMYVQCLRELHARRTTLKDAETVIAQNEVNIEETRWKLRKWAWFQKAKFEKRRTVIKLDTLLRARVSFQKNLEEIYRELNRFLEQAQALRKRLGGSITLDQRKKLDQDYWLHRLQLQVSVSILTKGTTPVDIIEMMPGLPSEVRIPLMEFIQIVTKEKAREQLCSFTPAVSLKLKSA